MKCITPMSNILLFSVYKMWHKEAEAVLNKFNIALTNQDLNRLHDGEELNDQVPLWTWKSKNLN